MELKTNNSTLSLCSAIALAGGIVLMAFSLQSLPTGPAWGFPWEFTLFVASLGLLSVGTWCVGTLLRRRRDDTIRYGRDEGAGGIILALWIISSGVLLLCFDAGVLPIEWRRVVFSWQMLLLAVGMNELARGRFAPAAVLLAVGSMFITRRLGEIYPDLGGLQIAFWPTVLIVAGVVLLLGFLFRPRRHTLREGRRTGNGGAARSTGVVDIAVVFGGSDQVYLDEEFHGGRISTVFGGVKLDLRRTRLPEGDTHLRVESVFGGVEIDAPEEWQIEIRNSSVFGGFNDKRLPPLKPGYDDGRKLVIHSENIFGGGELK